MAKFKVPYKGFVYVEAENVEEALDKFVYDEEYIYQEKVVGTVEELHELPRWIRRQFTETLSGYECSNCHTTWDAASPYCPYCGAKIEDFR